MITNYIGWVVANVYNGGNGGGGSGVVVDDELGH